MYICKEHNEEKNDIFFASDCRILCFRKQAIYYFYTLLFEYNKL